MIIKYKNSIENYFDVLLDLKLIPDGRIRSLILSLIASIGSFFLIYPFDMRMMSILIPVIMLGIFYFWFNKVNQNNIKKQINKILETAHNEIRLCDNEIILISGFEETKITLEKDNEYKIMNIKNNTVLTKGGKVIFIIPNNTFKTENDKNIFINYISTKI